jgi:hypothetical protein
LAKIARSGIQDTGLAGAGLSIGRPWRMALA